VSDERAGNAIWQDFAACHDTDTRLFFPVEGTSPGFALAICRRCPVRQACLAEALAEPALTGIWGGTTEARRHELRQHLGSSPIRSTSA